MSKAGGVGKAIIKVITYVLIVLLVLGIAGVIVYFVAKEEGVSFYVEYGGKRYFSSVSEADLFFKTGDTYTFNVKSLTGETVDYSVSVQSNGEHNFSFISDNEFHDFYIADDSENNDYSSVFGLEIKADSFSVTIPKDVTVEEVIAMKYGDEIQLQNDLQKGISYFAITVVSGGNSLSLTFGFELAIMVNPPSIVF